MLIGALVYLNDEDLENTFKQISEVITDSAIVVIREPIGIDERLTLKQHFSEELEDNYNAIYRTRDEIVASMEKTLFVNGFKIKDEAFLFDKALNNRKETAQYYFVLER